MNLFDGARRLAAAGAMLCFLGVLFYAYTYIPYVEMHYTWNAKNEPSHMPFGCSGLPEYRRHVADSSMYMTAIFCGASGGVLENEDVVLPDAEMKKAQSIASDTKFAHAKSAFAYFVVFLLAYWCLIYAIGWIMRGFLGIPKGQDFRITSAKV